MYLSRVFGALASVSIVLAQNVTHCVTGGVCYAVNIPQNTASSGNGDIYIHMSGPSSLSWIGIGQATGDSMRGSNIFMVYPNAASDNATLSPRLGIRNGSPSLQSTANVTLLEGSGIKDGMMVANFRCSNCGTWSGGSMSFTDSSSKWIWAYLTGGGVSSDSLTTRLSQHSNYGSMTLNLQTGTGGSDTNPFLGVTTATVNQSNNGSGSSATNGTSTSGSTGTGDSQMTTMVLISHGVLAGLAWVIFFPFGGISIRLLNFPGLVWMHAGWMMFTYLIVLASMGLGVWLAVKLSLLSAYHSIIGLVVIGALLLQPITGLLHHKMYKSRGGESFFTHAHLWWGRGLITLGIINGGLGLKLADNTRNGTIAYGVVAGVIWASWMGAIVFAFLKNKKRAGPVTENGSKEKIRSSDGPDSP